MVAMYKPFSKNRPNCGPPALEPPKPSDFRKWKNLSLSFEVLVLFFSKTFISGEKWKK